MTKRKKPEGNDVAGDQSVPIPIQTFLWRQTRYDCKISSVSVYVVYIIIIIIIICLFILT